MIEFLFRIFNPYSLLGSFIVIIFVIKIIFPILKLILQRTNDKNDYK